MRSKILVRILIVLLAAFLIFRIHQRVETYRVPRDLCRSQMNSIAEAGIEHMYLNEGSPAPDLDSLLAYAEMKGYFDASIRGDSVFVLFSDGTLRSELVPMEWQALWDPSAVADIELELGEFQAEREQISDEILDIERELGFSLDSLITVREAWVLEHPAETVPDQDLDDSTVVLTPVELFNDSIGFDPDSLLQVESELGAVVDSLGSILRDFETVTAPARMDSVAALTAGVCPSVWASGHFDSTYSYDAKLALGTQFSISCPNIDRHGGVVGGLVESDYPDTLFLEADWSENQTVYAFPYYAEKRRMQVSRANLIRAAEEQAAYLAQRYPMVIVPKDPGDLEVHIDELIDPMGGSYVFEVIPDSTYRFYENPEGRTPRARGDSISVETFRFVAYTTADPDVSRVEVYFSAPLSFPSRADGAFAGMNDMVTVTMFWDLSELGSIQIDEREVDLLDLPRWEFLMDRFGETDSLDIE